MSITGILIDSREPDWVQRLDWGTPSIPTMLDTGDLWAACEDGYTLLVERKTPDDLLGSLKDERLMPQMERMAGKRLENTMVWPYLMITGIFQPGLDGRVYTSGRGATGWSFAAVQGALLSIQEMGVMITYCAGDEDYRDAVIRLGGRKREGVQYIAPPRAGVQLGAGAALLASLPGIGIERVISLMEWAGNSPAIAISGLTDLTIQAPEGIGPAIRRKIRSVLGLTDSQSIQINFNSLEDQVLEIVEEKS